MLRVGALVPYLPDHAPGQRYRIEQWDPYLSELGVHLEFLPFETPELRAELGRPRRLGRKARRLVEAAARRFREVRSLDRFDAIYLYREAMLIGPAIAERRATRSKPVVFDFDDAIWLRHDNPTSRLAKWLKFPSKTMRIARFASAVTVGNAYLAEWARRYNQCVHIVPTSIDTERVYTSTKAHGESTMPVVGWTGSPSTVVYLNQIAPQLRTLRDRVDFRLRVIGAISNIRGDHVEHVSWSSASEVDDLLEIDIGLMPQPNNEWTRGKCGAKALQYMALGIPAVVSATGALNDIVEHDVDGLLVRRADEWPVFLERLLRDAALRKQLGDRARRTLQAHFNAREQAVRLSEILRSVAAQAERK